MRHGFPRTRMPVPFFLRLCNASAGMQTGSRVPGRGFSAAPPDLGRRPADADGFREAPTAPLSKNWSMARGRPRATLPPFGRAAACSPVGAWPRSDVVRCGCSPVAAYAETYSRSGNAHIYKCDRLAVDGKPVGRAGPEGRTPDAKGRMQPMPGAASAWVFKMAGREGGRVRGAAVPRRLCVRGRLLLADCLPRGRSASFLSGNCGESRGYSFTQP